MAGIQKSEKDISVVIVARNSAATLPQVFNAIPRPEFLKKIILVDHGSSDLTRQIAEDAGACFVDGSALTKVSELRNLGFRQTESDLVLFLDSDCILPESFFEIVNEIFSDQNIVAAASNYYRIPEDSSWVSKTWNLQMQLDRESESKTWLITRALVVRREAFEAVGGFDETLVSCEDVTLGYALSEIGELRADKRLAILHLGEPETLWQLFQSERWRGYDSIKVALRNFHRSNEILSLILTLWSFATLILLLLGILALSAKLFFVGLALFLLAPLVMAFRTATRLANFAAIPRLILVYANYNLARGVAVLLPRS